MKLSDNYTLENLINSHTAAKNNINNAPFAPEIIYNLKELAVNVMEPLRKLFKYKINSGYRCLALNIILKGSKTSQHMKGQAVDIKPLNLTVEEAIKLIRHSNIIYDQLIHEGTWIHISYNPDVLNNRMQYLDHSKPKKQ